MLPVVNAASAAKVCMTCGAGYPAEALFCPKDGTPLASARGNAARGSNPGGDDPYLGREVLGHIELQQLAGVGAMGRVYRAHQRGIDRDVAVKILHRELSANAQLVARFHREAKVASRLSHPNVVQVHLAGQLPDGALYIVMEYLHGLSLQSALAAADGAMDLVRALRITLQICDAVGEAHAQGVVHRDLKPENVMLVKRGDDPDTVKVLDFGIARLNWGEQSMATAAGLIFGTAKYISPEGAQGEAVGPAGDVYAIATLLYQMLSGRTPFDAEQAVALLVQQIHDPPPPLSSWPRSAYVPDPVARAVMANLAKEPTAREPDARAFGRTLLEAAVRSGIVEGELMARSSLLTARPQGAMQLASLQRTSALGPGALAPGGSPPAALFPDHRRSELPEPGVTQKWTPAATVTPPDLGRGAKTVSGFPDTHSPSQLHSSAAPSTEKAPSTPFLPTVPQPPMDDRGSRGSLEPFDPFSPFDKGTSTPPPVVSGRASRTEIVDPSELAASHLAREPAGKRSDPPPSSPPSHQGPSPDSASGYEEEALSESPRRANTRTAALVFLCFVVGVVLAGGVALRLKLIGPESKANTLDAQLSHARAALDAHRWDSPPGDNVRDLTNEGLTRWPNDSRIMDLRAHAADQLDLEAVRHEIAGDLPEALHLASLARELDPADSTAPHLVEKYQATLAPDASITPLSSSAPPPLSPAGKGQNGKGGAVTLDVFPARARPGDPVQITAHVNRGGAAVDPHFDIVLHGQVTRLPANPDTPSTFRGAYAFPAKGHYEVVFSAKIDGVPVRVQRAITASDDANGPEPWSGVPNGNAGASSTVDAGSPSTAPTGSVKWL
jgi:serine/threonine-protein kinase